MRVPRADTSGRCCELGRAMRGMTMCMQGLINRVDAGCQTEGSCTATAEELNQARAQQSDLQQEVSSLRRAPPHVQEPLPQLLQQSGTLTRDRCCATLPFQLTLSR